MPRGHPGRRVRVLTIGLTDEMIEELDWLVQKGLYSSRSEAIRAALAVFAMFAGYVPPVKGAATGAEKGAGKGAERGKEGEKEEEEDGLHILKGRA